MNADAAVTNEAIKTIRGNVSDVVSRTFLLKDPVKLTPQIVGQYYTYHMPYTSAGWYYLEIRFPTGYAVGALPDGETYAFGPFYWTGSSNVNVSGCGLTVRVQNDGLIVLSEHDNVYDAFGSNSIFTDPTMMLSGVEWYVTKLK
jgi:hypothetical protein